MKFKSRYGYFYFYKPENKMFYCGDFVVCSNSDKIRGSRTFLGNYSKLPEDIKSDDPMLKTYFADAKYYKHEEIEVYEVLT